MAHTRSVTTRAKLIARRFEGSMNYIHHDDGCKKQPTDEKFPQRKIKCFLQQGFIGGRPSIGFGSFYQDKSSLPLCFFPRGGLASCRCISTAIGEESDKISNTNDGAGAISDTTIDEFLSQASALNEVALDAVSAPALSEVALDAVSAPALSEVAVAIAAANSRFPVAALQYAIDYVHSFTGLNWWASIVIITLLIRGVTIPLLISRVKTAARISLMAPQLEEVQNEIQYASPMERIEKEKKIAALYKENGVHPKFQILGMLVQLPIFFTFYYAINNMVQNVPSFKVGGALWFTDLTSSDSLYILPILVGLGMLINTECNTQEGMQESPADRQFKKTLRVFSIFSTYICTSLPQGVLIFWITSSLFSYSFELLTSRPMVRKLLNVPEIPKPTPRPDNFTRSAFFKRMWQDTSSGGFVSIIRRPSRSLIRGMREALKSQPSDDAGVKAARPTGTAHSVPSLEDKLSKLGEEIEKLQISKK